jgi:glycosyltransferase involved in cell wall biosynthesis
VVVAARVLTGLLLKCSIVRARRRPLLLTVHNVESHDGRHPHLEDLLWFLLTRLVTDVHVLSNAGAAEVRRRHPRLARRRWHEVPHGNYLPVVADVPERSAARAHIGLPDGGQVVSTFGVIRPYKGTDDLFQAVIDSPVVDLRLVAMGQVLSEQHRELLASVAERDRRIVFRPGFAPEEQLVNLIAASDLVALPYRRVLNSGGAMFALSCGRPVLLPSTPTFEDLALRVGSGWVMTYEGPLTAAALERGLAARPTAPPSLEWCDWDRISEGIDDMWSRMLGSTR